MACQFSAFNGACSVVEQAVLNLVNDYKSHASYMLYKSMLNNNHVYLNYLSLLFNFLVLFLGFLKAAFNLLPYLAKTWQCLKVCPWKYNILSLLFGVGFHDGPSPRRDVCGWFLYDARGEGGQFRSPSSAVFTIYDFDDMIFFLNILLLHFQQSWSFPPSISADFNWFVSFVLPVCRTPKLKRNRNFHAMHIDRVSSSPLDLFFKISFSGFPKAFKSLILKLCGLVCTRAPDPGQTSSD